jgi:GT2 family glycosyltransferase
MKKVFIVLVTYNGSKWIKKCLAAIENSQYPVMIIIVDNGSSDNTLKIIKEEFNKVQLIESGKNLGFGQANNVGIKLAIESGADYCLLLNQDAYINNDSVETLINILESNSNIGILSPLHLDGSGVEFDRNFINFFKRGEINEFINDSYFKSFKDVYDVPYVNAAAWMIKKDCINSVGGFDPIFFHYGEDENYCHRALYHGYKIAITPLTIICHDRGKRVGIRPEYKAEKKLREQLIEMCNPANNTNKLLSAFKRKNRNKIIRAFLKLNFSGYKTAKYNYDFIASRENEIVNNTQKNRSKGQSWL